MTPHTPEWFSIAFWVCAVAPSALADTAEFTFRDMTGSFVLRLKDVEAVADHGVPYCGTSAHPDTIGISPISPS